MNERRTPKPDPSQRRRTPEEIARRAKRRAEMRAIREQASTVGEPTAPAVDHTRYETFRQQAFALDPFLRAIDPDEVGGSWPRVSVLCPRCRSRIVLVRGHARGMDYTVAPVDLVRDIGPGRPMSFADPAESFAWLDIYERETNGSGLPISWASHTRVALTCQRAKCSWSAPFRQPTLLGLYVAAVQSGELRFTPPSDTPVIRAKAPRKR